MAWPVRESVLLPSLHHSATSLTPPAATQDEHHKRDELQMRDTGRVELVSGTSGILHALLYGLYLVHGGRATSQPYVFFPIGLYETLDEIAGAIQLYASTR